MYKLVAIDLDGTLLKGDGTISEVNVRAIRLAREKGIRIVLATGRPIKGIKNYLNQLELLEDDYAIAFNGCLVQETNNSKIVEKKGLSLDDVHKIYELSKKLKVNMHIHTDNECITPKINKYSIFEAKLNSIPLRVLNFEDLSKDTQVIKIMLIGEEATVDKITKLVDKEFYDKYTVVRSLKYFLEFLNKKANKGEALKTLTKELGISMNEVIAIGDNENDLSMIKYAGLGVAMKNAADIVKQDADYITKSNEEDGVAQVIDEFILKKA